MVNIRKKLKKIIFIYTIKNIHLETIKKFNEKHNDSMTRNEDYCIYYCVDNEIDGELKDVYEFLFSKGFHFPGEYNDIKSLNRSDYDIDCIIINNKRFEISYDDFYFGGFNKEKLYKHLLRIRFDVTEDNTVYVFNDFNDLKRYYNNINISSYFNKKMVYENKLKIIKYDDFLFEDLSNKEINIIDDILSNNDSLINENLGDWFNKFIKYGKKGLLTAGIILSIAFSAQAQDSNKTNDVLKQGIELASNDVKFDVYSFMIGISKENMSLSMKSGDVDSAGGFKEISKHYLDLKNGDKPTQLSNNAKKCMRVISQIQDNLDKETINHFIREGNKIVKNY